MQQLIQCNPFRCKMWHLHDRLEGYITEESCADEIESVLTNGQLVPTLGRRLPPGGDFDVELIYGARRLFVARRLNVPLLVEIRELSDTQAILATHNENYNRKDISPYERGLSYQRWLRSGHFESQEQLARALGLSASQISRLLRIAQLPKVLVDAFRSPMDICEAWGLALAEAWQDPERRQALGRCARRLAGTQHDLSARAIYRELMLANVRGRGLAKRHRDEVVKSSAGAPLFRVRHNSRAIALLLPLARATPANLDRICNQVAAILENPGPPSQ